MINVTDSAATKIRDLLVKESKPETAGLRMRVVGGGCAGLQYQMGFDPEPGAKDKSFAINGVNVFIDPKSLIYLTGVRLDYVDGLYGAGFKIENPNAASTCGCGKSFS